jgi:hypothetical protein
MEHLEWVGKYIVSAAPDAVIHIGDHADMPSLSGWDKGRSEFHSRRYKEDIAAANEGWRILNKPMNDYNEQRRQWREKLFKPELHICLGNHEDRISRAIDGDRVLLEGIIGMGDLDYERTGWTVHEFKKPLHLDGVTYAHFFYNQNTGRPLAGANLETRLNAISFSFSMGHQQGLKVAIKHLANGKSLRGLVAGSCYLHHEGYRGPQAQTHWRGIIVKNEVSDGWYDMTEVSLEYLCRKYYWGFSKDDDDPRGLKEFMQKEHPTMENIFDVGDV